MCTLALGKEPWSASDSGGSMDTLKGGRRDYIQNRSLDLEEKEGDSSSSEIGGKERELSDRFI